MPTYYKNSGEGQLKLVDNGTTVELWVKAGYSNFWWNNLKFSMYANGSTEYFEIDYPSGAAWKYVGKRTVSTSQTVTAKLLTATGTNSLAGPTTFAVYFNRASIPDPPSTPNVSNVGSTSVYVTFADGDNNGASIDSRLIGYGTSSTSVQKTVSSDKSTTITGLTPGTKYYFWARTHNSEGWSVWSGRATATTLDVPDAPTTPVVNNVRQTTAHASWSSNFNGGSGILEHMIGWGKNSSTPVYTQSTGVDKFWDLTNLDPGEYYYVWAKSRNAIGWSEWSNKTLIKTLAGAWVDVITGGVTMKFEAVPYVNDNGVWRVALPYVKHSGVWKETT